VAKIFLLKTLIVVLVVLPALAVQASPRRTPVVEAVEKAAPAVVNIRTEQIVERRRSPFFGFGGSLFEEFFRDFSAPRSYTTQAIGSGVMIDGEGLILTNAHVINRASKIFVALPDKHREVEAKLVGRDERLDLALIRIPREEGEVSVHLELGTSADLMVGEPVIAIGNPLGLGSSITTGVVSGPLRALTLSKDFMAVFIQTDALINPGNSGGPLINLEGKVIGINTAIARQAQGIGFAVPADIIKRVLPDLQTYGRIRRSFLGVVPGLTGEQFSASRGYGGVLVTELVPGSPATQAGLQLADVILELDGVPVETPGELLNILSAYAPGNLVELRFLRGVQGASVSVTLSGFPENYALSYAADTFGFAVEESRGQLRVSDLAPDGPGDQVGMKRGDLIAQVAGREVGTLKEYAGIMEELFGHLPLQFLVVRGNQGYYIDLP
jgi:serine protease Do